MLPAPGGLVCKVSVKEAPVNRAKFPAINLSASIVTVITLVVAITAPLQSAKTYPGDGAAVSVTTVPST